MVGVFQTECCCSMGAAWGPGCERCPPISSMNYTELCPDVGFNIDGNGLHIFSALLIKLNPTDIRLQWSYCHLAITSFSLDAILLHWFLILY